jgi:hypothetical protein
MATPQLAAVRRRSAPAAGARLLLVLVPVLFTGLLLARPGGRNFSGLPTMPPNWQSRRWLRAARPCGRPAVGVGDAGRGAPWPADWPAGRWVRRCGPTTN